MRRQESDLSLHASDHNQASLARSHQKEQETDSEITIVWPVTAPTYSQCDDSDRESIVSQVDSILSPLLLHQLSIYWLARIVQKCASVLSQIVSATC